MNIIKKFSPLIIPIIVAFINVLIILFPEEIIGAARNGLSLWFNNVLPSLLPFVIGVNILTGLGFVNFAGVLLEPIMYPLFGVPGCGGFALVTGITSGYPMGAKTVAILREKNELSQSEAQRLAGFTNNSGPLFILGAVGVSMLGSREAGYFLMASHYLSAVALGLLLKNFGGCGTKKELRDKHGIMRRAYRSMKSARKKDGRSFGKLLGDSVRGAMETMVVVGGFVILFCVLVRVLDLVNLVGITERWFSQILGILGLSSAEYKGIFTGIIEITNGTKTLAENGISKGTLLAVAFVVSFGGLSIHAQAISFFSDTDIKAGVYIFCKLLQGLLSVVIGWLIYGLFNFQAAASVPVSLVYGEGMLSKLIFSTGMFFISILILTVPALATKKCG